VKKLALLSVAALMLASMVFAPVAMAQGDLAEVDVVSVTPGLAGSVTVTGTIQCSPGDIWDVSVEVRQARGKSPYNAGFDFVSGRCPSSGEATFTATVFGERPFKQGTLVVRATGFACDEFTCESDRTIEEFQLRFR
jgi:hypothetical protein